MNLLALKHRNELPTAEMWYCANLLCIEHKINADKFSQCIEYKVKAEKCAQYIEYFVKALLNRFPRKRVVTYVRSLCSVDKQHFRNDVVCHNKAWPIGLERKV